jgi:hypothetical protein
MVTEIAYSQAAVCADMVGMSLRDYTVAALEVANAKALQEHQTRLYEAACQEAIDRRTIRPTRHEWDRDQKPFVRRPAGVSDNQVGRPSSRHHQNGTAHSPGQKRAAAPERPGTTRSAASMARTREEPPFELGEHRGNGLNAGAKPQQPNRL